MRSFWVVCFFMCFAVPLAHSQTREPWAASDERFESAGLCVSFPNGTERKIAHSAWSRFGRDEWNYDVRVSCSVDASGQEVATIQNLSKGRVFSTSTIKESEWESYQGNLLRQKAIATESFGMRFTLDAVQDLPEGRLRFDYKVHSSTGKLVEEGYWVLGHGSVLEMIVERYTKKYSVIIEETRDVLLP
jgi:hypothetical protein